MRRWVYLLSALVAVVAFGLTASDSLYSWDSVNFALGVERFDVSAHRPHPPGYLALVWCARLLSVAMPVPRALLLVSAVAAALSCVVIWEVARLTTRSEGGALLAWSVVVSSPLLWFYASTAEIYAFELLASVACGAACVAFLLRDSSVAAAVAMGGAFGAAVLVKPSAAVLMLPLWLYAVTRSRGTARSWAVGAVVVGLGIGGAVLVSVVPLRELVGSTTGQLAGTVQADARFDPFHLLNRRVRDVLYALSGGLGIGGLVVLALWRSRVAASVPRLVLVAWAAPYLVMCIFVHFPKPGYALPLLAPIALVLARKGAGRSMRACVALALVACALNLAQFTLRPWSVEATGGSTRYASKTLPQKLATEANAVLRPSLATIEAQDRSLARLVASVPERCDPRSTAILVETGGLLTWRHAMYYQPEALVLQVGDAATLVGQRGDVVATASEPQSRAVTCVALVSHGRFELSGPTVAKQATRGQTIYWTTAPSVVTWTAANVFLQGATLADAVAQPSAGP